MGESVSRCAERSRAAGEEIQLTSPSVVEVHLGAYSKSRTEGQRRPRSGVCSSGSPAEDPIT